jgi:hypothetical protein
MNIPDGLWVTMESDGLSPHARLLLLDCLRRAARAYPAGDDLRTARPICVRWSDARLGMTRFMFARSRAELCRAGHLRRSYDERSNKALRDWFVLAPNYSAAVDMEAMAG